MESDLTEYLSYLDHLQLDGADNTIEQYRKSLLLYEKDFGGAWPMNVKEILSFIGFCLDRKHSPQSINVHLAALKHHLLADSYYDATSDTAVKKVMKALRSQYTKPVSKAPYFTLNELEDIEFYIESQVAAAIKSQSTHNFLKYSRAHAYFSISLWRGFRAHSMQKILVENINLNAEPAYIVVDSKTTGYREWLLPNTVSLFEPTASINRWLSASGIESGPLFQSVVHGKTSGKAMHIDSFNPVLKSIARDAGITKNISTHSMRRTLAIILAQAGFELYQIMRWVGWTNPSVASRYIDDALDIKMSQQFKVIGEELRPLSNNIIEIHKQG
jgi:integrase